MRYYFVKCKLANKLRTDNRPERLAIPSSDCQFGTLPLLDPG